MDTSNENPRDPRHLNSRGWGSPQVQHRGDELYLAEEEMTTFKWAIVGILTVVFLALTYGMVVSWLPTVPIWQIVIGVAILWLFYAIIVYVLYGYLDA